MNRTLHYGLPIFEASDKPSILVDFNQAMQDIDDNMFLIATGGDSSVAEAIAALQQGLASVTNQIAIINQTLGTKLDTSFMNNLAAEFDRTMTYFKYDFVFANGNLYQCIEDYDPNSSSFDICFTPVWLCNSVAKAEADLEELSDDYDSLEARVTTLENAPGYNLQPATTTTLGGIIVGSGLTVSASGVLDANPSALSPATASTLGGVKIGSGVNVASDGTISVTPPTPYTLPEATASTLGGVKVGSGINVAADGTISVPPGSISPATASTIGGIKIGEGVSIDSNDALNGYTEYTSSESNLTNALNELAANRYTTFGVIKLIYNTSQYTFVQHIKGLGSSVAQVWYNNNSISIREIANGVTTNTFKIIATNTYETFTYSNIPITWKKNGSSTTDNHNITITRYYMGSLTFCKVTISGLQDFDTAAFTISGAFNGNYTGTAKRVRGANYSMYQIGYYNSQVIISRTDKFGIYDTSVTDVKFVMFSET